MSATMNYFKSSIIITPPGFFWPSSVGLNSNSSIYKAIICPKKDILTPNLARHLIGVFDGVPDFLKTLVVDFSNLSEIGDAAKLNESYDIMQAVS